MRVLLIALLVLAMLALVCVALATPRATAAVATALDQQGTIRGSPLPAIVATSTSTHYADCADGSDLDRPTPNARTGPYFVAFTPCARESVGNSESTYCYDELHGTYPAALTADNLGARRLDRSILQTITGRTTTTTTSAAFA